MGTGGGPYRNVCREVRAEIRACSPPRGAQTQRTAQVRGLEQIPAQPSAASPAVPDPTVAPGAVRPSTPAV